MQPDHAPGGLDPRGCKLGSKKRPNHAIMRPRGKVHMERVGASGILGQARLEQVVGVIWEEGKVDRLHRHYHRRAYGIRVPGSGGGQRGAARPPVSGTQRAGEEHVERRVSLGVLDRPRLGGGRSDPGRVYAY